MIVFLSAIVLGNSSHSSTISSVCTVNGLGVELTVSHTPWMLASDQAVPVAFCQTNPSDVRELVGSNGHVVLAVGPWPSCLRSRDGFVFVRLILTTSARHMNLVALLLGRSLVPARVRQRGIGLYDIEASLRDTGRYDVQLMLMSESWVQEISPGNAYGVRSRNRKHRYRHRQCCTFS